MWKEFFPSPPPRTTVGTTGLLVPGCLVEIDLIATMQTAARAVLLSRRGTLAEQVLRAERAEPAVLPASRRTLATRKAPGEPLSPPPTLEFFNGLGGFASDGREYVTILDRGRCSPAPWINVVANAAFGFQVSESGSGYTWSINSRENQLTAWSNDPVGDPPGEVLYVRDDDTDVPVLGPPRRARR